MHFENIYELWVASFNKTQMKMLDRTVIWVKAPLQCWPDRMGVDFIILKQIININAKGRWALLISDNLAMNI